MKAFALSYYILLFSEISGGKVRSGRERRWGRTGKSGGRGNCGQNVLYENERGESSFNLKKERSHLIVKTN